MPHTAIAQSTDQIDWDFLELIVFKADATEAAALVSLPSDNRLHTVSLRLADGVFRIEESSLPDTITITIAANGF